MPLDSARQFLEKLQNDAKFRQNLVLVTREQGHVGRSKYIKDAGFDFDVDDLTNAKQEYVGKVPKDLTAIVDFITCGMIIDPPSVNIA